MILDVLELFSTLSVVVAISSISVLAVVIIGRFSSGAVRVFSMLIVGFGFVLEVGTVGDAYFVDVVTSKLSTLKYFGLTM